MEEHRNASIGFAGGDEVIAMVNADAVPRVGIRWVY